MNLEERQKQINDLITAMAKKNNFITLNHVTKARNLYLNSDLPLEQIEADLTSYSENIRKTAQTKATIDMAFAEKQELHDREVATSVSPNKQVSGSPLEPNDVSLNSGENVDKIDDDLSTIYSANQPASMNRRLGDIIEAGMTQDPTDELDSMFDSASQNDFAQVDSFDKKTAAKVYSKSIDNSSSPNLSSGKSHGFSTINSLLTIAALLSIMGIIISTLIIYTR